MKKTTRGAALRVKKAQMLRSRPGSGNGGRTHSAHGLMSLMPSLSLLALRSSRPNTGSFPGSPISSVNSLIFVSIGRGVCFRRRRRAVRRHREGHRRGVQPHGARPAQFLADDELRRRRTGACGARSGCKQHPLGRGDRGFNDGGAGIVEALGIRLLDVAGDFFPVEARPVGPALRCSVSSAANCTRATTSSRSRQARSIHQAYLSSLGGALQSQVNRGNFDLGGLMPNH